VFLIPQCVGHESVEAELTMLDVGVKLEAAWRKALGEPGRRDI